MNMETKVSDRVFEYIEAIAQNLGVAAEYVYSTLVTQKFVEGIAWAIVLIVFIIVSSIIYRKLLAYAKTLSNTKEHDYDELSPRGSVILFSTIVYCAIIVITILNLPTNIMKIYNPDYYAIKEILDVFKK